jgi:hypothetical protein
VNFLVEQWYKRWQLAWSGDQHCRKQQNEDIPGQLDRREVDAADAQCDLDFHGRTFLFRVMDLSVQVRW